MMRSFSQLHLLYSIGKGAAKANTVAAVGISCTAFQSLKRSKTGHGESPQQNKGPPSQLAESLRELRGLALTYSSVGH